MPCISPGKLDVNRDGLILIDDARMRLFLGEAIELLKIRFKTVGCYPITGAGASGAEAPPDIILELLQARSSERHRRYRRRCVGVHGKEETGDQLLIKRESLPLPRLEMPSSIDAFLLQQQAGFAALHHLRQCW